MPSFRWKMFCTKESSSSESEPEPEPEAEAEAEAETEVATEAEAKAEAESGNSPTDPLIASAPENENIAPLEWDDKGATA